MTSKILDENGNEVPLFKFCEICRNHMRLEYCPNPNQLRVIGSSPKVTKTQYVIAYKCYCGNWEETNLESITISAQ